MEIGDWRLEMGFKQPALILVFGLEWENALHAGLGPATNGDRCPVARDLISVKIPRM